MEFASYEDMVKFESDREKYYMDFIHLCDGHNDPFRLRFYKRLFLDAFHPRYRAAKKLYDGYQGGYWRDDRGYLCAKRIDLIDERLIESGEICIERDGECIYAIYVKKDGALNRFTPEQLKFVYQNAGLGQLAI